MLGPFWEGRVGKAMEELPLGQQVAVALLPVGWGLSGHCVSESCQWWMLRRYSDMPDKGQGNLLPTPTGFVLEQLCLAPSIRAMCKCCLGCMCSVHLCSACICCLWGIPSPRSTTLGSAAAPVARGCLSTLRAVFPSLLPSWLPWASHPWEQVAELHRSLRCVESGPSWPRGLQQHPEQRADCIPKAVPWEGREDGAVQWAAGAESSSQFLAVSFCSGPRTGQVEAARSSPCALLSSHGQGGVAPRAVAACR